MAAKLKPDPVHWRKGMACTVRVPCMGKDTEVRDILEAAQCALTSVKFHARDRIPECADTAASVALTRIFRAALNGAEMESAALHNEFDADVEVLPGQRLRHAREVPLEEDEVIVTTPGGVEIALDRCWICRWPAA